MHPVEVLHRHGGAATWTQLLALSDRTTLDRLVRSGDIVRDARGRYALPVTDEARRAANALTGVASHLSAAAYWGWEVKRAAERPHITVPRSRRVAPRQRRDVVPHWADLEPDDVHDGWVTRPRRTLVDCLTTLPFDEALAVADSALRRETVTGQQLMMVTDAIRGRGAPQARRIARHASGLAANPFESVLRAIAVDVPGLCLEPQVVISETGLRVRPDLVDVERRLVVEADSHTWHSSREALRRDCRRYDELTVRGWTVLRFTWEDVMFDPAWVRSILKLAADRHAHFCSQPGLPQGRVA